MSGATYSDEQIRQTMRQCYDQNHYILDPHGACGYQALKDLLLDGEVAVTEDDIKTRTFVSAYLDDFAVHHGVCWFVICLQIKPVM